MAYWHRQRSWYLLTWNEEDEQEHNVVLYWRTWQTCQLLKFKVVLMRLTLASVIVSTSKEPTAEGIYQVLSRQWTASPRKPSSVGHLHVSVRWRPPLQPNHATPNLVTSGGSMIGYWGWVCGFPELWLARVVGVWTIIHSWTSWTTLLIFHRNFEDFLPHGPRDTM